MFNATLPDLLRLVAIPAFAWAAWQDIHTRRIPNRLWPPLLALGGILIVWEAVQFFAFGTPGGELFAIQVGISLLFVGVGGYVLWWVGAFGAADAKALIVLAVLLPTFPSYMIGQVEFPVVETALGVFSLTVLTNGVLVGLFAPAGLAVSNLWRGDLTPKAMPFARPVRVDSLPDRHGRIFENRDGVSRNGLDLDVLRMYLRWRGLSLAGLRTTPETRDPESITQTHDPTDGRSDVDDDIEWNDPSVAPEQGEVIPLDQLDDPWGVDLFFNQIEQPTYGTDAEQLREGLELLATTDRETIWVAPGLPFVAPIFIGCVIAFTYGDLLFSTLGLIGIF
jgi:preflagellin peptidase FlaK